jgi:hypothetical protein
MPIPPEHSYRLAYHFTLLDNLPGIISGGLLAPNEQRRQNVAHRSIAEESIQARRSRMPVTCGPGGVVHDYVPFYFTSLSPMLQAVINAKNVDQHDLIHLAVPVTLLDRPEVVFTNAAANASQPPAFYTDPLHLKNLRWDLIDPQRWKWTSEEKHLRMAEMLVHSAISLTDVSHIIVWNEGMKKKVEDIFAAANVVPLPIEFSGHRRTNHYFTTFWNPKSNVSIVTGPKEIYRTYKSAVEYIASEGFSANGQFPNLRKMLKALRLDLAALPETAELVGLESENDMHREDVGNHTLSVVRNLRASPEFLALSENDQMLIEIAAYFHDIGKGPKERWADKGGKQQVDPNHPVGGLIMLVRILTQEVALMKQRSARVICKLVCYHDLVGDIFGKGRDPKQLEDIVETEAELDMLIALGLADMRSVNPRWADGRGDEIAELRARVLTKLNAGEPEDEE